MALEWLELARAIADAGSLGIIGWLLWERWWWTHEAAKHVGGLASALKDLSSAVTATSSAVRQIDDSVRAQHLEIARSSRGRGRG